MKDLSYILLKNTIGSKMKKGLRTFCNDNGSTSTLNQKIPNQDQHHYMMRSSYTTTDHVQPSTSNNSPTLEEMILQLELEEAAARKAKEEDSFRDQLRRRMSCVNNSDVLKSARNALNQYPRFSLDGRDAMYRSSFGPSVIENYESRRKSVCHRSNGHYKGAGGVHNRDGSRFDLDFERTQNLAGDQSHVIWCKPGVVAKLMGLESMPLCININQRRNIINSSSSKGKLGSLIKKENLRRAGERQEMEKRSRVAVIGNGGCRGIGRDMISTTGLRSSNNGYSEMVKPRVSVSSNNGYSEMVKPRVSVSSVETMKTRTGSSRPTRRHAV